MPFYERLGFTNHPFAQTNADEEPFLEEYFVPPPFFDAVIGDPSHPGASIVLAPRGGGKSAQRRKVEMWAATADVLAVTYDRFEFGAGQKLEDISLPYHLRNVLVRLLVAYLSRLADNSDLLMTLSKPQKRTLALFVHSYLGGMTGEALQTTLKELKSIPQRIREFWSANVGFLESLVNVLMKNYGLEAIDLPDAKQEEKKLEGSYKHQLEVLRDIASASGVKSIYVLVDKLDESEKTGTDPERTYKLLRPLIQDLELLSLPGYGFKIFAWDLIAPHFHGDARPDRIPQYSLKWSRKALEVVLSKRLAAFSEKRIGRFAELMKESLGFDVDGALCIFANSSPRNLIRICEKIFAVQAEQDPTAECITPTALDRGLQLCCEEITMELYGADICNDLKRVGRELFTINYLANDVFKARHENTSRNKVTAWQNAGVVTQIDEVSITEARRPVNLYMVTDPAMCRVVQERVSLRQFLADRWLQCAHCQADSLMPLHMYPDGNDPVCATCRRPLVS